MCPQLELVRLGYGLLGDTWKCLAILVHNPWEMSLSNFRFPAFKFLHSLISAQVVFA